MDRRERISCLQSTVSLWRQGTSQSGERAAGAGYSGGWRRNSARAQRYNPIITLDDDQHVDRALDIELEPSIPPARVMSAIGEFRWFTLARVRQIRAGRPDDFIRLAGEWHGKTKNQAEAKALRAAKEWIAERSK